MSVRGGGQFTPLDHTHVRFEETLSSPLVGVARGRLKMLRGHVAQPRSRGCGLLAWETSSEISRTERIIDTGS